MFNTAAREDGTNAVFQIVLLGDESTTDADGLRIAANDIVIRGLVISGFGQAGIRIEGGSRSRVEGNLIGLEVRGNLPIPNGAAGVVIENAAGNYIGGSEAWATNVISANEGPGVLITGRQAFNNFVLGNLIGLDTLGTRVRGNQGGVVVDNARTNTIGGADPGAGNQIAGNDGAGVALLDAGASENKVIGNDIGVGLSGEQAMKNTGPGVLIQDAAVNLIGGPGEDDGNVISGNGDTGVSILGDTSSGNRVEGNFIGTDRSGTVAIPNFRSGVMISGGAFRNTIGGAEAGNTIAFNRLAGIQVPDAVQNAFISNVIHSNGGLGIDQKNEGVTAPEEWDSDDLRNSPVLTKARRGETTLIEGYLESTPNTAFRLEFFANRRCDDSGFGEGEMYVGTYTVTTDPFGRADFSEEFPFVAQPGWQISATATDSHNTTSEFAKCIVVPFATD